MDGDVKQMTVETLRPKVLQLVKSEGPYPYTSSTSFFGNSNRMWRDLGRESPGVRQVGVGNESLPVLDIRTEFHFHFHGIKYGYFRYL